MDVSGLRALIEIAESGSFSKAAKALHLSQPAVSKRIALLEAEIGVPLFDRIGRLVQLTAAGHTLLPHARQVLQELEDGRRALSRLTDSVAGRLSVGTSHHIGLRRLPTVLRSFTQQFPLVDLDLHFMDSELACDAVLAGRLELGIVTLPPVPIPRLNSHLIWNDPLLCVAAPDHALSAHRVLSIQALAQHPAVLPDAATYTHRIISTAFEAVGLQPRVRLATNYLETLKMLVGIGLGWSVLPASMLDASICALPVEDFAPLRTLGVVHHQQRTLSAAARALLETLQAQAVPATHSPKARSKS